MQLLTVHDAAKVMNASKSLVYQLVAERKITTYKIGHGAIRFRLEDLLEYLEQCRVEAGGAARLPTRSGSVTFQHLDASRLAEAWRGREGG
jgi:excisionase family DNA binding protein